MICRSILPRVNRSTSAPAVTADRPHLEPSELRCQSTKFLIYALLVECAVAAIPKLNYSALNSMYGRAIFARQALRSACLGAGSAAPAKVGLVEIIVKGMQL
jgi:hypothetical protein